MSQGNRMSQLNEIRVSPVFIIMAEIGMKYLSLLQIQTLYVRFSFAISIFFTFLFSGLFIDLASMLLLL